MERAWAEAEAEAAEAALVQQRFARSLASPDPNFHMFVTAM